MNDMLLADMLEKFRKAKKKLVLLDYDGTLVNYSPIPETATLSEHLSDILVKLIKKPKTDAFIITGRGYQDIDKLLDHLPINIIAEHGAMIKMSGLWKNEINDNGLWKETIIPVLEQFTLKCHESYVEEKKFSLAWHYRNSEPESGYIRSRELIRTLNQIIPPYRLKLLDGNKVVELMSVETGKGKAVKKLLEDRKYDFILSIGDDATDEEMFLFFFDNTSAYTIKVGNGDTYARYKLASINDVMSILKQLSE